MSSYGESYANAGDTAASASRVTGEFREQYPTLSDVLSGIRTPDDKGFAVWPASISIFSESGRVKFCVNPKVGPKVAFGTLSDPSKGFDALEWELAQGRFEWKFRGSGRMSR